MMSVTAVQPCESRAEKLQIISNVLYSKWLMLTATVPSFPWSHLDEARTSLWLCEADQLTNDREEGGAEGESEQGIE